MNRAGTDLRAHLDDLIIPLIAAAVGLVPVIGALAGGGSFDAGATIGLVMLALGILGVVAQITAGLRARRAARFARPDRRSPWRFAWPMLAIAAVTALGLATYGTLNLADVAMLYLVAIILVSLAGRGPSLLAAALGVMALDYGFVPPRFTWSVAEPGYLITFAVLFGAAVAFSELLERLRRRDRDARTEELRSAVLSTVSHDLRSPLALITGAATSLRDDASALDDAGRHQLLDTIVDEAGRLGRVVTDVLAVSRVQAGVAPAREWVSIEELVGAALGRLESVLAGRVVVVDVPGDLLAFVDPRLIEHLLINLVDNAIRHGAPPIEIHASRDGDELILEVCDDGAGILPADRERVFERFVRGSDTRAAGVGLGLAVCRGVALAHDGTIEVDAAPRGGARLRTILPQPPLPLPEPA